MTLTVSQMSYIRSSTAKGTERPSTQQGSEGDFADKCHPGQAQGSCPDTGHSQAARGRASRRGGGREPAESKDKDGVQQLRRGWGSQQCCTVAPSTTWAQELSRWPGTLERGVAITSAAALGLPGWEEPASSGEAVSRGCWVPGSTPQTSSQQRREASHLIRQGFPELLLHMCYSSEGTGRVRDRDPGR